MKTVGAALCGLLAYVTLAHAQSNILSQAQWEALEQDFDAGVEQLWGKREVWTPRATQLTHYSADLLSRGMVDFAMGEVRVEQLLDIDADTAAAGSAVRDEVLQLLRYYGSGPSQMVRSHLEPGYAPDDGSASPRLLPALEPHTHVYRVRAGDTLASIAARFGMPVEELAEANRDLLDKPAWRVDMALRVPERPYQSRAGTQRHSLLEGQLLSNDGSRVTRDSMGVFATQVAEEGKLYDRVVLGEDGKERMVVGLVFTLADDHLAVRSRQYLPLVREQAERWGLSVGLTMAIIHTESAFNPRAVSPGHAYGLMQVVPTTAGREAYSFLHGQTRVPSTRVLFDPRGNIELGTAYLHLLDTRYFKDVQNPDSRLACVIAAYNAGPARVRQVLDTTTTAATEDPSQMQRHLIAQLPTREARAYLPEVLGALDRYRALDGDPVARLGSQPSSP